MPPTSQFRRDWRCALPPSPPRSMITAISSHRRLIPTVGMPLFSSRAYTIVVSGRKMKPSTGGAALECVRKALDLPLTLGHAHHTYCQVGGVYAVLGDTDKAMAWLEQSVDTGNPCWPFFKLDPHLENLRPGPRFQRLVAGLEREYTALKIKRL
jgi:hypothetical protein